MHIVFLDESGYTSDWQKGIGEQPFYALGVVALPVASVVAAYSEYRNVIDAVGLRGGMFGRGEEVKSKDLANGSGRWARDNTARNAVRSALLTIPKKHGGFSIVVVVDKDALVRQYSSPADPYRLAFTFALERLGNHLSGIDDHAYCVYDQNTRTQSTVLADASSLVREGSRIIAYSSFYGQLVDFTLSVDRILELGVGDSAYSVGLQFADGLASFAYAYHKQGKPTPCGWWQELVSGLRTYNGTHVGAGYKLFP